MYEWDGVSQLVRVSRYEWEEHTRTSINNSVIVRVYVCTCVYVIVHMCLTVEKTAVDTA